MACLRALVCFGAARLSVAAAVNVRYGLMPLPYLPYSKWSGDPQMGDRPEGFIVDLLEELGHLMKWNLTYVPMGPLCQMNAEGKVIGGCPKFATGQDSYLHDVRQQLAADNFDLSMLYYDDPTGGFAPELRTVKQSVAFHTQIHSVGVQKIKTPPPLLALFDPFTSDLWAAICLFSVAYGMLLFVLHRTASMVDGDTVRPPSLSEAVAMQYHALAMVLSGEAFDNWRSRSLKLARLGMLFFVLVFGATYTANLAAFFTADSFRLVGPQTKTGLAMAKACVQQAVILPVVQQSIGSHVLPPPDVQAAGLLAQQRYCAQQVLNASSGVEAMVGLVINLREFLDKGGCEQISHVSTLDFAPVPFQLGYVDGNPRLGPNFGEELDAAIVTLMRSPRYTELRTKWLYDGFFCPGEGPGSEGEQPKISFYQMRGLFLCSGLIGAIALLVGVAELVWHFKYADSLKVAAPDDDEATEAGMLRSLLSKVDDLRVQNILADSSNKVIAAFGIIDKDGSGSLTHDELFNGLHKHAELRKIVGLPDDATFSDFQQFVQDADTNGDGRISLGEFETLCPKWQRAADSPSAGRQQKQNWELSTVGDAEI